MSTTITTTTTSKPCLKKNCAKLFLSEFRHISTNSEIFWRKDGEQAK